MIQNRLYVVIGLFVGTLFVAIPLFLNYYLFSSVDHKIFTGAFLADAPSKKDIINSGKIFGKKPYFILLFVDWGHFISDSVLHDIVALGSVPVITWEPWNAKDKKGVDYDALVTGAYDPYVDEFATRIKALKTPVYLRFAHEMNGNWYPWSTCLIGESTYAAMYRRVHDRFTIKEVNNVHWIFSVNHENVPFDTKGTTSAYPGDDFVDYFGIDGYNWGDTTSLNSWKSFHEIVSPVYREICRDYTKEILITEFGSTSVGGNKTKWLQEAFRDLRKMKRVRGFILFNVDKETDWAVKSDDGAADVLRKELRDPCFIGATEK